MGLLGGLTTMQPRPRRMKKMLLTIAALSVATTLATGAFGKGKKPKPSNGKGPKYDAGQVQ
jgi:hypothetical protein